MWAPVWTYAIVSVILGSQQWRSQKKGEVSLSTGCPWRCPHPPPHDWWGRWVLIVRQIKRFSSVARTIYSSSSLGFRFRGMRHLTTLLERRWQWQEPWWPPFLVLWAEVPGRSRSSSSHTPQSASWRLLLPRSLHFCPQTTPPKLSPLFQTWSAASNSVFPWHSPFGGFLNPPLLPTPNNNKTQAWAC